MFTQLMNKHADSMANLSHGRLDHKLSNCFTLHARHSILVLVLFLTLSYFHTRHQNSLKYIITVCY